MGCVVRVSSNFASWIQPLPAHSHTSSVSSRKYVTYVFRRWELQLPRNRLKRNGASAPEVSLPSFLYFRDTTLDPRLRCRALAAAILTFAVAHLVTD
jgi:hypothetical protein